MNIKILFSMAVLMFYSCGNSAINELPSEKDLKMQLRNFLETKNEVRPGDSALVYVVDLLKHDPYNMQVGIYKFGVLGAHSLPYLVYITEANINIIQDYTVKDINESYKKFISSHVHLYSEYEKQILHKNLTQILETRMSMIEKSTIQEEIEY